MIRIIIQQLKLNKKEMLPISIANRLAFFKFLNTSVSGNSMLLEKVFDPIVEGILSLVQV